MFSSQIALNLDHSKADLSIYLDILYCLPGPQTREDVLSLLKFLTSEIELGKCTLRQIQKKTWKILAKSPFENHMYITYVYRLVDDFGKSIEHDLLTVVALESMCGPLDRLDFSTIIEELDKKYRLEHLM